MKKFVFCAILLLTPFYGWADSQLVAVTGHGKVSLDPDKIDISFAVGNTKFKDVEEAKADVEKRAKKIAQALRKLGVKEDDISSPRFEVNAEQSRFGDQCQDEWYPTVTRYIEFTLRDVKKYGTALDVLVKNGMTRLQNISPGIVDELPHKNKALADAIKDAKSQAAFLAKNFDTKIAGIHSIGERQYRNNFMMKEAMQFSARDVQQEKDESPYDFKPGKIDIEANIYVEFELAPNS